jgi:hypothetical protein
MNAVPEEDFENSLNFKKINKYVKNGGRGIIGVGRYPTPETVLHEMGHIRSGTEFPSVPINNKLMPKYKRTLDEFNNIAEENMASSYALDNLRNQPNLPYAKKVLDNYINTYVVGAKSYILKPKYRDGIPLNSKFIY